MYERKETEWRRVRFKTGGMTPKEYAESKRPLINSKNQVKSVAKDAGSGIIKTSRNKLKMDLQLFANGKERANIYGSNWGTASLKEAVEKFAPGAIGIKKANKGKIIYQSSDGKHSVVYDYNGNYFRIENHRKKGKRRYVDMDGNDVANITENGKTRGRTKDEYESITHFSNSDI